MCKKNVKKSNKDLFISLIFLIKHQKLELETYYKHFLHFQMKQQQLNKSQSLDGPPIDFSFKSIRSLNQLLRETKEKQNSLIQPQQQRKEQVLKKSPTQQNNGEEDNSQNSAAQNSHQTKLEIIRTIEISETKILDMNKNASKKKEKNQKKLIKVVESKSSALFLRYNKITSIEGLFGVVEKIFPNINNLIWIDLSFNRLTQLVDDFGQFENLKNIYLHSNYIYNFKQVEKLAKVKQLRSLTIYANPLEKFGQFRILIANIIPQLQKIDSTLLTKREKQRGQVIRNQLKKYPVIKNPEPRPQQSDNQEDN